MKSVVDVYPYRLPEGRLEFLIFKRAQQVVYPGQWRMIGGKVKKKETYWQAALRELREETGNSPVRFWALPSLNHFYDPEMDAIRLIPAFAAQLPDDPVIELNEEHTGYRWIAVDDIDSYIQWPEQKRLMKLTHRILATSEVIDEWEIDI